MLDTQARSRSRVLTLCASIFICIAINAAAFEDPGLSNIREQGSQALKAGKYDDAISAFKKAIKLQPSCADCYLSLSVAYMRAGRTDEALKTCDRAIAVASDDGMRAAAHNLKGNLLLAISGDDKKKLAAAEWEYRTATGLDAKFPMYHVNLAKSLLRQTKDDEGKKALETCLSLNPDERLAKEAQLMLADPRRGRFEFAPEFKFQTLQGQEFSLQQLQGKVLVFDFWATWCPPCRASVPELKDLAKKYPSDKLVLISVSADDDEQAWRDFIAKKKMDWPQYRDSDNLVIDTFSIHSFPTYLVVDGEGIIRQRITGLEPQQSVVGRLKSTLNQMPQLEGEARK